MTPEQFRKSWSEKKDNLNPIPVADLEGSNLQPTTMEFLINSGLPDSAAPFLSFVKERSAKFSMIGKLTEHYTFLEPEFSRYVIIGSTGEGDIIAVDTALNDVIVSLDHEDNFSARYFNSSVSSLAGCLLIYRNFIDKVLLQNNGDSFVDSDFSDEQFENLKMEMEFADKNALSEESFWSVQLRMDLGLRDHYRQNK